MGRRSWTPLDGTYGFSLDHSQSAAVWIDNRQVLGNLNGPADMRNAVLDLSSGRHAIRVRYEKTSEGSPWITLFWTPPGGTPSDRARQCPVPATASSARSSRVG